MQGKRNSVTYPYISQVFYTEAPSQNPSVKVARATGSAADVSDLHDNPPCLATILFADVHLSPYILFIASLFHYSSMPYVAFCLFKGVVVISSVRERKKHQKIAGT